MDGLPVLGFAALVVVVIGVDARLVPRGALIGATLGLALWTHSQALLLIPLGLAAVVLTRGVRQPRELAHEAFVIRSRKWGQIGPFSGVCPFFFPAIFKNGESDPLFFEHIIRGLPVRRRFCGVGHY
jgi:hypothetical protein